MFEKTSLLMSPILMFNGFQRVKGKFKFAWISENFFDASGLSSSVCLSGCNFLANWRYSAWICSVCKIFLFVKFQRSLKTVLQRNIGFAGNSSFLRTISSDLNVFSISFQTEKNAYRRALIAIQKLIESWLLLAAWQNTVYGISHYLNQNLVRKNPTNLGISFGLNQIPFIFCRK